MKTLNANQAIVIFRDTDFLGGDADDLRNYTHKWYVLTGADSNGRAKRSTNVDAAKIFTVSEAHEAIMAYRTKMGGNAVSMAMHALGWIPENDADFERIASF